MRRRLLLVALAAAVGTGVLAALLLGSPLGPSLAIPGPISEPHASLVSDCGNCHSSSLRSVKGPLHGIVTSPTSVEDSSNCMGCHAFGPHALEPHSPSPRDAAIVRASAPDAAKRSFSEIELACATCHHEHRGRDASLTALEPGRCQSCHEQSFASISQGHPPFGKYPYVRRLSIAFDHASHIGRHFQQDDSGPETCMSCHRVATDGGMRVLGFEAACGSCHAAEIEGYGRADATGVAFLGLPAVDVERLEDASVSIGMWPADAAVSDAPLTAISALLLSADPRTAADLRSVEDLDWLDLADASDEQLVAIGRIVWDVKAMLAEFAAGGHEAMRKRLEGSLGRKLDTAALAELTGALSPAALRSALDAWLPGLDDELRARSEGSRDAVSDRTVPPASEPAEDWVLAGGWYADDYSFTLRRRPRGHADPFLKGWIDLSADSGGTNGSDPLGKLFAELSDAAGPGRCAKCHGIDTDPVEQTARVHWNEARGDFSRNRLGRFSHEPHVALLDERGCRMCHELAESTAGFEDSYAQGDATHFVSAFAPLEPDTCASCHAPEVSGSDCLTCHQYHAERSRPARLENLPPLRSFEQRTAQGPPEDPAF